MHTTVVEVEDVSYTLFHNGDLSGDVSIAYIGEDDFDVTVTLPTEVMTELGRRKVIEDAVAYFEDLE